MSGHRRVEVAVVVATYRRADLLRRCLDALCAQSLDGDRYEIVIADDDGGRDGGAPTRAIVDAFDATTGGAPRVHYVPVTATQGPAGARNAGWRATNAPVIAFTDDDTIPDVDWLAEGLASLRDGHDGRDAVGGSIQMPLPARPTDYERDAAGLSRAEFATANCFVGRHALDIVGGFDERFTSAWREDSDLQFALMKAGFAVGFAPAAVVVHPIRPAPFGVSVSQQRKAVFDALLFKKHRALYRSRIERGPPWLYRVNVAALLVAAGAAIGGSPTVAALAGALWVATTLRFMGRRLRGNSKRPRHVVEMLWTSIAIPPLALWWRLVGAWRFRVAWW